MKSFFRAASFLGLRLIPVPPLHLLLLHPPLLLHLLLLLLLSALFLLFAFFLSFVLATIWLLYNILHALPTAHSSPFSALPCPSSTFSSPTCDITNDKKPCPFLRVCVLPCLLFLWQNNIEISDALRRQSGQGQQQGIPSPFSCGSLGRPLPQVAPLNTANLSLFKIVQLFNRLIAAFWFSFYAGLKSNAQYPADPLPLTLHTLLSPLLSSCESMNRCLRLVSG